MSVEIVTTEKITCKHCGSEAAMNMNYKGVPRYYCKICRRKFKSDDMQFKMKTDSEQVGIALNDYYDGRSSIRAIQREILVKTGKAPSTIYEWIQKYTQYITDSIKDYHPNVSGNIIVDETAVKVNGHNYWLWDCIDEKTRYLLASRLTRSRTTRDAQLLIDKAIKTADKGLKVVKTDKLPSYLDVNYGKEAEAYPGLTIQVKRDRRINRNAPERWHGTLKARTKTMRGLKNFDTASEFVDGFLAYYNYLRPHESLNNRTPAQEAGIEYPYRNWQDIIRNHKPSKPVTIEHQKRGLTHLPPIQIGRPKKVRISQKPPRITPLPPRISRMPGKLT